MKSFKSFSKENEENENYILIIETPDDYLKDLAEGKWFDSGKNNYQYRVDPEIPSMKVKRHVTVAHKKHTGNKNMQASWNIDSKRHDNKTFNKNIGSRQIVQDIAKRALKLGDDIVLEEINEGDQLLIEASNESANDAPGIPIFLKLKDGNDS